MRRVPSPGFLLTSWPVGLRSEFPLVMQRQRVAGRGSRVGIGRDAGAGLRGLRLSLSGFVWTAGWDGSGHDTHVTAKDGPAVGGGGSCGLVSGR